MSLSPAYSYPPVCPECSRTCCLYVYRPGVASLSTHDGRRRGAAVDGCSSRTAGEPHHRKPSREGGLCVLGLSSRMRLRWCGTAVVAVAAVVLCCLRSFQYIFLLLSKLLLLLLSQLLLLCCCCCSHRQLYFFAPTPPTHRPLNM